MKEVRIYFECLEQGAHFIKPILEQSDAFKKKPFEIKLIKLTGNFKYYSKLVAPIVYLKDPDILITVIENEIEYPLFQLEISTAVFTEDHELQRFDGIVASTENNCIYGKLSPINKTSQSAHGGNTKFDYITSYKAAYEKFRKMSYHFDWPCDEKGNVIVNSTYLSCPKEIKSLTSFLHCLMTFAFTNKIDHSKWINEFEKILIKENEFAEWKAKIDKFNLPDLKTQNTSRTEWKEKNAEFHLKINRFGHAMDPERGMLAYYGTIWDNTISKMLFDKNNTAWYKDTPNEKSITSFLNKNGLKTAGDFLHCFLLGSGTIRNEEFQKTISKYIGNKKFALQIDLTKFLTANFYTLNKSLRTVFKFSKQFHIIDTDNKTRVKFIWKTFSTGNDFTSFPAETPIQTRTLFDEDDITYISVHNVLRKNGHKLIAVSYPGAQGDRVVLAEAGTGRRQQRRYIDIVSYLPKSHTVLQENKGKFTPASIQKEIIELSRYKSEKKYKASIEKFVDRFEKEVPHIFKVGVGFWANAKFTIAHIQKLDIAKLDYFIFIQSDQTAWKVFSSGKVNLFTVTEGIVKLPIVFEIKQDNTQDNQLDLF